MKCEKCNKNEANFYYRATINGKTEEKHLCADCAREEGLDKAFDWHPEELLGDFFGDGDSFFGDFFGGSLLPGFARTMLAPMLTMPRFALGRPEQAEQGQEQETAAPEARQAGTAETKTEPDAGLNARRELNALRHQLKEAVRAEDFEKAIGLRDRIRELEK